jgi:DNA-3-methyladenine glycosylase
VGIRAQLGRPAPVVAPALLGWTVSNVTADGTVTVRLTEVEAYQGADDPASHAFRGPTARNRVMFGPAGYLYVYRSYGVHWAMNVVTGEDGVASAVLLRAGEVVAGASLARSRRGEQVAERDLARGPGNLAQALGVVGTDTGTDLVADRALALRAAPRAAPPSGQIVAGPRVGVTKAPEVPWRFWLDGDPTVSAYRRSPRIRGDETASR